LAFTRSRTQRAYNSSAVPPRSRRAIDPSLSVTLGSLSFPSLQSPARRTARNMGGKCKKVLAASRATRKPSRWANQAGSRRADLYSGKRQCLGRRPRSAPRRHRRRALAASRCRGKLAPRTHRSLTSVPGGTKEGSICCLHSSPLRSACQRGRRSCTVHRAGKFCSWFGTGWGP
jgi:hypothetical protein